MEKKIKWPKQEKKKKQWNSISTIQQLNKGKVSSEYKDKGEWILLNCNWSIKRTLLDIENVTKITDYQET